MEGVLSSIIHLDSSARAPSHLLARNALQLDPDRARRASRDLLGLNRQLHVLLQGRPIMGDEQPLVGNQWRRRRELATQTRRALGWAAVGLERSNGQVRPPHGPVLLCDGLGGGVAPRA